VAHCHINRHHHELEIMIPRTKRPVAAALLAATSLLAPPASAVRVNPDGHGQALVYPYYTARPLPSGNTSVTALSVINATGSAKAVKVRILEGKTGAEVLDFNLFLSQYDVWTAGIVPSGAGAGLFTLDNSCTTPVISNLSSAPTLFRNGAYVGDSLGDGLDRTYEGYIEILEMGAIASGSALEAAVTHRTNLTAPNASRPTCNGLVVTTVPMGLVKPSGGLSGNVSYINVNEGTDVSIDALALAQWSDKVQWGPPVSAFPNLSDASPAVSSVVHTIGDGDVTIVSTWTSGRDAVSAVLMVATVRNDYTVEPAIKAATDWIVTMPTKRFHFNGASVSAPFVSFLNLPTPLRFSQVARDRYYDREERTEEPIWTGCYEVTARPALLLPFSTTTVPWIINCGTSPVGLVLGGQNLSTGIGSLPYNWLNGWAELAFDGAPQMPLTPPPGRTTVFDHTSGIATKANVTYYGLPIIRFAAQSYSTTGLPGINPNVLSAYGGAFVHKMTRRIEISR
jgi:hypothetical protein